MDGELTLILLRPKQTATMTARTAVRNPHFELDEAEGDDLFVAMMSKLVWQDFRRM